MLFVLGQKRYGLFLSKEHNQVRKENGQNDRTTARERIGLSLKKRDMSCGGVYLSDRFFFLFYILLFKTFLFPNSRRNSRTHKGKKDRGSLRKVVKIQPILRFHSEPKIAPSPPDGGTCYSRGSEPCRAWSTGQKANWGRGSQPESETIPSGGVPLLLAVGLP